MKQEQSEAPGFQNDRLARRTGKQKVPTGWLGRKSRDLVLPLFLWKGAEAAARLYEHDALVA